MTEITQADRDAAAPYAELLVISEPVETLAQSFARHRMAERQRIVTLIREKWDGGLVEPMLEAIEAGEWE